MACGCSKNKPTATNDKRPAWYHVLINGKWVKQWGYYENGVFKPLK